MGKSFNKKPIFADIQNRKIFESKDILIYFLSLVLVLVLFLTLVVFNNPSAQGVKVSIDDKVVLTHVYNKDFWIDDNFKDKIEVVKDGQNYFVKIFSQSGFNTLVIDESAKSAKIQESDCPTKNCVYMHAVKNSGAIYCAPRKLKVSPIFDSEFIPPTTGGIS